MHLREDPAGPQLAAEVLSPCSRLLCLSPANDSCLVSNSRPAITCLPPLARVSTFSLPVPPFFFFPVYTEQTAWETQFLHCKPSHTWAEGSEIFRFIKKELGDRAGGMTLEVKCFHKSVGTWVWPPDPTSKSWADTVPERGRQEDPWRLLESQSEQTDELQFQCLGPVSR